jgi:phage FluMu protein Com
VLGSVKKTINVVVVKNEDVIAIEKSCKITLEDF